MKRMIYGGPLTLRSLRWPALRDNGQGFIIEDDFCTRYPVDPAGPGWLSRAGPDWSRSRAGQKNRVGLQP